MLSRGLVRCGVKVVSASLVESLPAPDKEKPSMNRNATLTFHLQRFRASERFGVDCAFRPFGDTPEQCFVRRMPADLVTSSAVLRGVLGSEGKAAHKSAVRVTSINGVTALSQATVRELLDSGRDVVIQCAVSGGAESNAASEDPPPPEGGEEVEVPATPKRRGRRKAVASSAEDEAAAEPKKPGRRGRRPAGTTPGLSKKRMRNSGARAAAAAEPADVFASGSSADTDVDAANAARAEAAHDVDAAALASLSTLLPVKLVRRRGRPPKKAVEGSSVTRTKATPAKPTEDDVWFAGTRKATKTDAVEGGEDGDEEAEERVITFASADSAPRKRRGRPRKVDSVAHVEEDQGAPAAAAEEEEQEEGEVTPKCRGRKIKTATASPALTSRVPKRRGRRGSKAQAALDDVYAAKLADVKSDEAASELELEF